MKYFYALIISSFLFSACSTPPVAPPIEPTASPSLNYLELQNRLGVELAPEVTGYREKAFDACDLGSALGELKHPLNDCHHAYFILVQFQLSCRADEDTPNVLNEADLTPVQDQKLRWEIGKLSGDTLTDFQGRAVVRAIAGKSTRKNFLRISTGKDFLSMRVEQATAIVTPPSWCTVK
ncbi:MAG: hypothetical protein H7333_11680 [Bdellovibrionales bacterium]|nr:hypothetical protein [Oligoflexia bacterium]